jgi:hypothetical protein
MTREHALDDAGHGFDRLRHDHGVSGPLPQSPAADQLHILNVCFLTPQMRREFGGTAGNIATT